MERNFWEMDFLYEIFLGLVALAALCLLVVSTCDIELILPSPVVIA